MDKPARQVSLVPAPDLRQSETSLAIARCTSRLLRSLGFSCISELPLPSGRRADLVALNERGEIWIVEIKSSIEDLRADQKWQDYRMHCDRRGFVPFSRHSGQPAGWTRGATASFRDRFCSKAAGKLGLRQTLYTCMALT